MRIFFFTLILYLAAPLAAHAQDCPVLDPTRPPTESAVRTLTGKVVYHDEIRPWIGFQLDSAACGRNEIELLQRGGASQSNPHAIDVFRDCHVTVTGRLGLAGSGYHAASIYQDVQKIAPLPGCNRQPPIPDYANVQPDPSIKTYKVSMTLDSQPQGGHIAVTVQAGARTLTPWQPYAHYYLTDGDTFSAFCADDFAITAITGTPTANPLLIDNQVTLDPLTALKRHTLKITLTFTCRYHPTTDDDQ